jgi:hypothetical protein
MTQCYLAIYSLVMIFNMSMYSVFYIVYALVENKAFDLI